MTNIGLLGCGKIGQALVRHIKTREDHFIVFIQDPFFQNDGTVENNVIADFDKNFCKADLPESLQILRFKPTLI